MIEEESSASSSSPPPPPPPQEPARERTVTDTTQYARDPAVLVSQHTDNQSVAVRPSHTLSGATQAVRNVAHTDGEEQSEASNDPSKRVTHIMRLIEEEAERKREQDAEADHEREIMEQIERLAEAEKDAGRASQAPELTEAELHAEFSKYQYLNELDSEYIQDKFEAVKYLLMYFGIPWVQAPQEAEAQCAYLEMHGLVDGIMTDDSDVFLFGGKNVYRGMFDGSSSHNRQKVCYYSDRVIRQKVALDRERLVNAALLLGSDYTLGIRGVGPVNATEIIACFPDVEALARFRQWAMHADILIDNVHAKHYANISRAERDYKERHKNYKKQWEIPEDFPDTRVVDAYWRPVVDESLEKFQWGKPNLNLLHKFCVNRFEWSHEYTDAVLQPLTALKDVPLSDGQKKITDYFKGEAFAFFQSSRLIGAIQQMKKTHTIDEKVDDVVDRALDDLGSSQRARASQQQQQKQQQQGGEHQNKQKNKKNQNSRARAGPNFVQATDAPEDVFTEQDINEFRFKGGRKILRKR